MNHRAYCPSSPGSFWVYSCVDLSYHTGLQTSQDARFYALSSRFEPFSNEGKPLVIQFSVKHEQKIDCGGGYVKVFPSDQDQTDMHGDSKYYLMFGEWMNQVWSTEPDSLLMFAVPFVERQTVRWRDDDMELIRISATKLRGGFDG